jgi:hypothetical protein
MPPKMRQIGRAGVPNLLGVRAYAWAPVAASGRRCGIGTGLASGVSNNAVSGVLPSMGDHQLLGSMTMFGTSADETSPTSPPGSPRSSVLVLEGNGVHISMIGHLSPRRKVPSHNREYGKVGGHARSWPAG